MPAATKRVEKSAEAYRSIGEAADELGLQTHVLRYWEGKFARHLKPKKRPDGRRMFRPEDMLALKAIQLLVHERGFTLKGAAQLINEQGIQTVLSGEATLPGTGRSQDKTSTSPAKSLQDTVRAAFGDSRPSEASENATRTRLEATLSDLEDIKSRLDAARLSKAA